MNRVSIMLTTQRLQYLYDFSRIFMAKFDFTIIRFLVLKMAEKVLKSSTIPFRIYHKEQGARAFNLPKCYWK